jgi:hypothetical protein
VDKTGGEDRLDELLDARYAHTGPDPASTRRRSELCQGRAVIILHRLSRGLRNERLIWWNLRELGHACGIGHADKVRSTGLLVRTLGRLQQFSYLRQQVGYPQVCEIRTQIPPLSSHRGRRSK